MSLSSLPQELQERIVLELDWDSVVALNRAGMGGLAEALGEHNRLFWSKFARKWHIVRRENSLGVTLNHGYGLLLLPVAEFDLDLPRFPPEDGTAEILSKGRRGGAGRRGRERQECAGEVSQGGQL